MAGCDAVAGRRERPWSAERIRADSLSGRGPSLLLLFTRALGRSLAPITGTEENPTAAWPRLQRFEAVAHVLLRLPTEGRRRFRLGRLSRRLDHRFLFSLERRRGRRRRRRGHRWSL